MTHLKRYLLLELEAVSYTHLDVYKRQRLLYVLLHCLMMLLMMKCLCGEADRHTDPVGNY